MSNVGRYRPWQKNPVGNLSRSDNDRVLNRIDRRLNVLIKKQDSFESKIKVSALALATIGAAFLAYRNWQTVTGFGNELLRDLQELKVANWLPSLNFAERIVTSGINETSSIQA